MAPAALALLIPDPEEILRSEPTSPGPIQLLIARLCRRDAPDHLALLDIEGLTETSTAQAFLAECARHGVRGLVLKRLLDARSTEPAAESGWAALFEPLPLLRKQATLWELEQDRILTALRSAGTHPIVLKGGALRHMAYDHPLERWMGDLDLLVHAEDMTPLLSTLSTLGYSSEYSAAAREGIEEHHYHHVVTHPNGFIVEAHQGLTRPGAPCALDPVRFFQRATEIHPSGGAPMLVPSPEDMVLHLVSQIEQEGCRRLSRIVDLDRVIAAFTELDWDYLRNRGEAGNLGVALAVSLRLANLLLSTPVPDWAANGRGLPPASRRGTELARPVEHLLFAKSQGVVAAQDLFRFWLLPSWTLRGARLRELAARRADPLEWVWEGKESPEEGEEISNGGLGRLLKMAAYQLWTETAGRFGRASVAGSGTRHFWGQDPEDHTPGGTG
ncbi:MAG: nucleotidyltransferase family protein [Gemmatimonadota bacterium]